MKQLAFNGSGFDELIQNDGAVLTKDEMYRVRGGDGEGNGELDPPPIVV